MRKISDVVLLCMILSGLRVFAGDSFMGDWEGVCRTGDEKKPVAVQVIALGQDLYEAYLLDGFEKAGQPFTILSGKKSGDEVVFEGPVTSCVFSAVLPAGLLENELWTGCMKADGFICRKYAAKERTRTGAEPITVIEAKKTVRLSPTLGARPQEGAVILLSQDSVNLEMWRNLKKKTNEPMPAEWTLADGILEVVPGKGNLVTRQEFGSCRIHLEFRTPFLPEARGQARGNSGVYVSGRYEVQVLDSYGLPVKSNECGGVYGVSAALVNMCAPPLQWQTYDMNFTAPEFKDGKKIKKACLSVVHNGVRIHDRLELPLAGKAGIGAEEKQTGPLLLQDHNRKVQYRNIWIVPVSE